MTGTRIRNPAETTTAAAPGRRGPGGVFARIATVLVVTVFGLWLATPWLAPAIVARFLPAGWALEEAAFDRPGLWQSGLSSARLGGRVAGLDITVELEGASWRYADNALHADVVRVTALASPGGGTPTEFQFPEDLTLPRLVMPTPSLSLEVDRLELNYGEGDAARSTALEDLRLDGEADRLVIDAELPPNATVRVPSRLNFEWGATRFLLDWTTANQATEPALHLEQVLKPGAGNRVDGVVQLDLDLAVLDPGLLNPLADALGLEPPLAVEGRLFTAASLEGDQVLELSDAGINLQDLRLSTGNTALALDLDASVNIENRAAVLSLSRLAIRSEGPLPTINNTLALLLKDLPLDGLDATAPLILDVSAPPDLAEPLEFRFSAGSMTPARASGGLRFDARLGDATRVSATAPDIAWTRSEDVLSLDARGLQLRLRQNTTLILRMDDGNAGFGAAEVEATGDFSYGQDGVRFSGRLDAAEFSDFSITQAAATARLRTLGLSGPLTLGAGAMNFEGQLGGAGFIVAPVDAVAASSLVTVDSLAFTLQASGLAETRLSGRGSLNGIALPDLGVTLDGVDLDIGALQLPAVDGTLAALTTGLEVVLDGSRYSGMDLDIEGALSQGRFLEGKGSLLLGFTGEIPFRYAADLDRPTLEATLDDARLDAGAMPAAARALALTLPENLRFGSGELVLDGRIAYADDRLAGALRVRGESLALGLGESRFEGLDFTTEVDVAEVISGRGPLALALANLAAGLDLTDLSTSIEFQGADLGLVSLDASLLGGRLRTPGLRLAGGQLQGTLIEWTGFDLGKLLSFVDVNGLSGSGTLDATFPIVNDGAGPAVEAGRFAARGPGVLRYTSGVPATNIGLQALENFQYDSLEGQLDYANNGAYTIALDLLGRNPDLYGGHPVRFRLNLGGEMPALFRSLFITGDFDKAIIERLRAGEPALPETLKPPGNPQP